MVSLSTRLPRVVTGRSSRDVLVTLMPPQPGADGGWFCSYRIDWPEMPRHSEIWGADSVQALYLTLERIGLELYNSPHHEAGELVWDHPGKGYGFPLPENIRHLAVGADRHIGGRSV